MLAPSKFSPYVAALWLPFSLAGVIILAGVVRIYDIGANPPGFFADEAAYGYNAYTILHTGKDEFGKTLPFFFESFGEYKLPVYVYSIVPFVAAMGLTEVAVRLTSALYGVLTVVAVYFLVQALFGRRPLSLAAALFLATQPWHIFYSRTGLGEITVHVFFVTLALYVFLLGTKRPRFLLLSALLFAMALYSYRGAWVITPPLLLVLTVLYHRELLRHWRFSVGGIAILALACIPILLLLFNVEERAQDRSIFTLDLGVMGTIEHVARHYVTYFRPSFLFDGTAEHDLRHAIPGVGWIYPWQAVFLACGVLALAWRTTRPKLLVLSLVFIFPLAGAVTVESPSSANAFFGSVAFAIIAAYGLVTVVDLLLSRRPADIRSAKVFRYAGPGLAAVLICSLVVYAPVRFAAFLDVYHGRYQEIASGRDGWQWGGRAIVERFLEVEDDYDRLWIDTGAFVRPGIFIRFYAPEGCLNCHVTREIRYEPDLRHFYALGQGALWFEEVEPQSEPKGSLAYREGELIILFAEVPIGVADPAAPE